MLAFRVGATLGFRVQTLIGPRSEILFVTLDGVDNRVMGKEPDLTVS